MTPMDRRQFIQKAAVGVAAVGTLSDFTSSNLLAADRKMTMSLSCGSIGVSANQREAIELAAKHGFEAVELNAGFLASLTDEQLAELKAEMKAKAITYGAASLPVEFRQDEAKFSGGLKELPKSAAALQKMGATRVSTWIMPSHDSLTYLQNFRQHATRLREVAKVLRDAGLRLGLEYVGPKTLWTGKRYPFIHTMAETKELISEIGTGNVGFLLDTFHWWNAGEGEADLLTLKNEDVVSVDLNDAVAGVPREQQVDSKRELPCATGVIPTAVFLNALSRIGYDGPVRAEPFNQAVRSLPKDEACAVTAKALKQAFALISPG
jgi:sugar phosphate isomerase/epimerase